jgi:hypothetical protein
MMHRAPQPLHLFDDQSEATLCEGLFRFLDSGGGRVGFEHAGPPLSVTERSLDELPLLKIFDALLWVVLLPSMLQDRLDIVDIQERAVVVRVRSSRDSRLMLQDIN